MGGGCTDNNISFTIQATGLQLGITAYKLSFLIPCDIEW